MARYATDEMLDRCDKGMFMACMGSTTGCKEHAGCGDCTMIKKKVHARKAKRDAKPAYVRHASHGQKPITSTKQWKQEMEYQPEEHRDYLNKVSVRAIACDEEVSMALAHSNGMKAKLKSNY